MQKRRSSLTRAAATIFLSVLVTILIVRSGAVHDLLRATDDLGILTALIAGVFFASVFTVVPAGAVLGELSQGMSPLIVAFFGAIGCLLSDLLINSALLNRAQNDADDVLRHSPLKKIYRAIKKRSSISWLAALIGAIIVASPFPDEVGLFLMSASKIRRSIFIPLLFALDFLGIYLVGLAARALMF